MTSGYDALDELYERLRGQEDAQRAGGITPETIRAARGGVADENGRIPATAAENAADGDSLRDTGDSRDSRERIEADAYEAARLHMSRTWEERRDAIVALLDRQAALTERHWMEINGANTLANIELNKQREELQRKVDELRAELATAEADNEYLRDELAELRSSRTVEDVLSEFASRVLNSGHQWGLDAHDVVAEYAAEIRELKEVDG